MTAYALKPNFIDRESYRGWLHVWKLTYQRLSEDIRRQKVELKDTQRRVCRECLGSGVIQVEYESGRANHYRWESCPGDLCVSPSEAAKAQKNLHFNRRTARKMMTLLEDAERRWERITAMHRAVAEQPFPLVMEASRIDFHYNKVANEFPFMPNWTVKAKGKTFYVRDVVSQMGFSTMNRDEGNTRGLLRFRGGILSIDEDGIATISERDIASTAPNGV